MPGPFDQSNVTFSPDELLPDPLPADPFPIFLRWYEEAMTRRMQPNPNAMSVATVGADGTVSVRILLCKEINPQAGYLVFFTNYLSRKGRELDADPRAAAAFHWDHLDRQVRIEGRVVRTPEQESEAYFATRPWESRIGAWASLQSEPLASRHQLLEQTRAAMLRFGLDPARPPTPETPIDIPRPPHWGGYRLFIQSLELWTSGPGRLHDRAVWVRTLEPLSGPGFTGGSWRATRMQP